MRWLLVLSLTGLAACSSVDGQPRAERALPEPITVSSPAFTQGAAIPQRFTCDGDNLSPPLRWSGVPTGTAAVALVVDDPDAPRGTYVHWLVVGLDPASTTLAEATVPPGVRQVRNSAGKAAYTGPCPPGGPPHHYRFTIYASSAPPTSATTPAPKRRSSDRGGRHRSRAIGWDLRPLNGAERPVVPSVGRVMSSHRARPTARWHRPGFAPQPVPRRVTSSTSVRLTCMVATDVCWGRPVYVHRL